MKTPWTPPFALLGCQGHGEKGAAEQGPAQAVLVYAWVISTSDTTETWREEEEGAGSGRSSQWGLRLNCPPNL